MKMTNEEVSTLSKFIELLIKIDKRVKIVAKSDYKNKNQIKTKEKQ